MNIDRLVTFVNEIATIVSAESPPAMAAHRVERHLARFWHPTARQALKRHSCTGGLGLSEVSKSALALLEEDETTPSLEARVIPVGPGDAG